MAKLAFHVSVRPQIYMDQATGSMRQQGPEKYIDHSFRGINFTYKTIISGNSDDSRCLIEFEIQVNDLNSVAYSVQEQQDLRDVIVEGLMPYSGHIKSSITAAQTLAESLSGETVNIVGTTPEETLDIQWPI